jgi:outer membrane protein assembly factor BamB
VPTVSRKSPGSSLNDCGPPTQRHDRGNGPPPPDLFLRPSSGKVADVVGPRELVVLGLLGPLLAACSPDADPDPAPGPSTDPTVALAPAWELPLAEKPFVPAAPNSGGPVIALGEDVLVLTRRHLVAVDAADGAEQWRTTLPGDLCAGPPSAADTGLVAVLTGSGDDCSRVVALDAGTGQIAWDRPIPGAADALGQGVAVGPEVVTVTGGCVGYARFRVADGSLASADRGDCATAASDGASVVTADRATFTVVDAASGRVERRVRARGLDQVGQVLSSDPLVVTARLSGGRTLVDLSGRAPAFFGEDEGGYGGQVRGAARSGDLLWVQYDARTIAGFDLTRGTAVAGLPLDAPGELVGATEDAVWVASERGEDRELLRFAADDSQDPALAGVLPPAPDEAGPVRATALLAGHVLTVRDGRVDAVPLP